MPMPSALLLAAALGLSALGAAHAAPWRQHEAPFDFVFGNEIDNHQQTRKAADGSLSGFLYVRHTGVLTLDGYPVATHADCDVQAHCRVGWLLDGRPASATFLYQPMHDHAVFLVARADIPQPGSHAHFHWLGAAPAQQQPASGYLLQLRAVDRFCFVHHGAESASPARSCRDNGGVAVDPGIDIATHLNIVGSAPPGF